MKWEYKTLKVSTSGLMGGKFDENTLTEKMNELGREEWELTSGFDTNMGHGATRDIVLLFKRASKF